MGIGGYVGLTVVILLALLGVSEAGGLPVFLESCR